jgi:hypothetical protein
MKTDIKNILTVSTNKTDSICSKHNIRKRTQNQYKRKFNENFKKYKTMVLNLTHQKTQKYIKAK